MAPIPLQNECPVCHITLSQMTDGTDGAKESHVQTCIESHLSALPIQSSAESETPFHASKITQSTQPREGYDEGASCPICHTSYLTQDFDGNDAARETHFTACFESQSLSSKIAPPPASPPSYNRAATFDSKAMSSKRAHERMPPDKEATSKSGAVTRSTNMPVEPLAPTETPPSGFRRLSIFGFGGGKSKEERSEDKIMKADGLMRQRWGPPGSPNAEMVRRYWMATRMEQHWEYLRAQHPKQFRKYLNKGYME